MKAGLPKAAPRTIRADFGLSPAAFAKMTGLSRNTLAKWEQDPTVRLDDEAVGRVARVAHILKGLARVMRRAFIPTWIGQPNAACREIGVTRPLDLYGNRDYETLEDMIWYLESGMPG